MLETLAHDFRSKRRDRVLRLDVQPGRPGAVLGLEDLCATLKDVIKATFEARAKAYDDEVQPLLSVWGVHALSATGGAPACRTHACWVGSSRVWGCRGAGGGGEGCSQQIQRERWLRRPPADKPSWASGASPLAGPPATGHPLPMQVRKLMAARQERGWQFSTLFLVKDSLGVMLEAGGLLEDALREYYELEACFLEALSEAGALTGHIFGAGPTDCAACLLRPGQHCSCLSVAGLQPAARMRAPR